MAAIYEAAESTQLMHYRVADQAIVIEAYDSWAAGAVEQLFAGWYLTRETEPRQTTLPPAIVISSGGRPPAIPVDWPSFEIAGGGTCATSGPTSYIEIEGSIVAIGKPGQADVEVWTNGMLEIQSPALTRVVTYALAAALRRRHFFELHSGAVIDPQSGKGALIIGPSGSGKSTLTVQLAAAGWPFLTDDVLGLTKRADGVTAWPLRRCFAITAETFAASSFLQSRTSIDYTRAQLADDKTTKKPFVPHGVFNSEFKDQCTPAALFFTQVGGADRSNVSQLSAPDTMARLIRMSPWSCYDQTTAPEHLAVLAALVNQSKGYALVAGKDLLDPETASDVLARYTRD